jgi:hypothetical protein
VLLEQPFALAAELQARAVHQQVQGLAASTSADIPWPRHVQRRCPAAERAVVGNRQSEPEQVDDGAEQAFGLAQRQADTALIVSAVRMASGEYRACPSRVVRGSAAHAAITS